MRKATVHQVEALRTEKDGRLYAIAMFEALEELDTDTMSACSEDVWTAGANAGQMVIFRKMPQDATFKQWVDELYARGTTEARNGFFVVLTDYVGSVIGGSVPSPASEFYKDQEGEGQLEPWGTVNFRDEYAAKAALASGDEFYSPRVLS